MAISSAKGDLFPLPQQLLQIVKAGDPVLHEPACEVDIEEIGSEKIEKIIQNTISVMRKAPGVGLAAPQIGIPSKVLISTSKCHYVTSNGYFISLQQTR
ncbi:peptide deformylase chloroplastic-like protein [Cinnamomum micranthum f. kanehirae]|uniref:Peptide deformylase n=1 Tax=Cinnamomum micranthum f. kanehirae TaxID=337451 RepID=A0A3S3M5H3_9MAGN|nr:peptide deformylase chloroplastic-like protein [Cinnamomum micranthum f. kanehirae]